MTDELGRRRCSVAASSMFGRVAISAATTAPRSRLRIVCCWRLLDVLGLTETWLITVNMRYRYVGEIDASSLQVLHVSSALEELRNHSVPVSICWVFRNVVILSWARSPHDPPFVPGRDSMLEWVSLDFLRTAAGPADAAALWRFCREGTKHVLTYKRCVRCFLPLRSASTRQSSAEVDGMA